MIYNHKKFKIQTLLIILLSFFMMMNTSFIINAEGSNQTTIIDGSSFNKKDTLFATDENGTKYYSSSDAWNAALDGKIITMQCDWILENKNLSVKKNKTVTLYMNGHKIDADFRNRVIYIAEGATLNLYGGESKRFTYNYYDLGVLTSGGSVTSGGLVTGSKAPGSGSIRMVDGAKFYAKDIAICGNISTSGNFGGGGLEIFGDDAYVEFENVIMSYNYGYRSVGGICISGQRNTVILRNTEISHNYTHYYCGGIGILGNSNYVDMLEGSTVSYNYGIDFGGGISLGNGDNILKSSDKTGVIEYNKTKGHGAGIDINNKVEYSKGNRESVVDGLTIRNNYCTNGDVSKDIKDIKYDGDGGGIYVDVSKATIINCTIENNGASLGGGVYINGGSGSDATVIKDTTIKNNYTPGKGGGIFVSCTDDVKLSGNVYIENNKRVDEDDDIFLNTGFFDTKAYIFDDISSYSRVGIRLDQTSDLRTLVKNVSNYKDGTYFLSAYTSEDYLNLSNGTLSSQKGASTYLVTVNDEILGRFKVGEIVTVKSDDKDFFYCYSVSSLAIEKEDLMPSYKSSVVTFKMLTSDVKLTRNYYSGVNEGTLKVDAPVAGQDLPTKGIFTWTNEDGNQELEVNVSWLDGNKKASGKALYGTSYILVANLKQNVDKNLLFGSNVEIYGDFSVEFKSSDNQITTYKAKATGTSSSITLKADCYSTKQGEVYLNGLLYGSYYKGDTVLVDATSKDKRFLSWDQSQDVTIEDLNKSVASFVMSGQEKIYLTANYTSPITDATLTIDGIPTVGQSLSNLSDKATLTYKVDGKEYTKTGLFLYWRILNGSDSSTIVSVGDQASYNTSYLACVDIAEDKENGLTFNSDMKVTVILKDGDNKTTLDSTVRIANNTLYVTSKPYATPKRQIKYFFYKQILNVNEGDDASSYLPTRFRVILEGNIYKYLDVDYSNVEWNGLVQDGKFAHTQDGYVNIYVPFKLEGDIGNDLNQQLELCVNVKKLDSSSLTAPNANVTCQNEAMLTDLYEEENVNEIGNELTNVYNDSIYVALTTNEDETIYYKLSTDGEAIQYSEPILLSKQENASTTYELICWSEKDGLKSNEVSYTYIINPELKEVSEDSVHTITVKYKLTDGSNKEYTAAVYNCLDGDTITLRPSQIENAMFDKWQDLNNDLETFTLENIKENKVVYATYNPVVTSIDFTINDLKLGKTFDSTLDGNKVSMKLDNGKYDLSDCLTDFQWFTDDDKVYSDTSYIAKVRLDKTKVTGLTFVIFEDDYKITVNGNEDSNIDTMLTDDGEIYFIYDELNDSVDSINQLDSIEISRENYLNNNYSLPSFTSLKTTDGQIIDCPIKWDVLSFDLTNLDKQELILNGILTIPSYLDCSTNEVSVKVTLDEADKLDSVISTVSSGTYSEELYVRLYTLDDADIYYFLDGFNSYILYKGEGITVNKSTTIKAYSLKEGYKDSDIVTYTYTINGALNKKPSELDGDVLETSIIDNTDSLYSKVLTDEDKEFINQGNIINVYLKVSDIVSDDDKSLINSNLDGYTIGKLLDISLYKNDTKALNTDGELKITIELDDSFTNANSNVNRSYKMLRIHNNQVSTLNSEYDSGSHTISFSSDKFSTYAIVYKDTTKGSNPDCSSNYIWSETKKACVYKVSNTSSK